MNSRNFLVPVLFLASLSNTMAQVSLQPPYQALGDFRPGTHRTLKVKIANNSGQTLALSNLHADCECTTAKIPLEILKPNASTFLVVQYHPPLSARGPKSMEVNFNYKFIGKPGGQAVPLGKAAFHFMATLLPETFQDPATINLGYVVSGKSTEGKGELYLDPKVYPHWKPGRVESDLAQFPSKIGALPTPGHYQVAVLAPATAQPGHYKGSVMILGATQKDKSFTYPFEANVGSHWTVSPAAVTFDSLTGDKVKNWKAVTEILLDRPKTFKILKADGAPEWLKYDVQNMKPGGCAIHWRVDEGLFKKAADKSLPGEVKVVTDQALESTFNIPIHAGLTPDEKK